MITGDRKLLLGVKRSRFRVDDPDSDHSSRQFMSLRKEALTSQNYTCHYCGFQAKKYQEVHHLDDDHSNNSDDNLVVTCPLCHACNHIGLASVKNKGCLIYIDPAQGVTQESLNQMVRVLWVMESAEDKISRLSAISILSRLYKQSHSARKLIGTAEPMALAQMMLEMSDEEYANRESKLRGLYLLPFKDYFQRDVDYYTNVVFKNVPASMWGKAAQSNIAKWFDDLPTAAKELGIPH